MWGMTLCGKLAGDEFTTSLGKPLAGEVSHIHHISAPKFSAGETAEKDWRCGIKKKKEFFKRKTAFYPCAAIVHTVFCAQLLLH